MIHDRGDMINAPMDDDEGTEVKVPEVPADPPNTFRRDLAGRSILFRTPASGQATAVMRAWQAALRELERTRDASGMTDAEKISEAGRIVSEFELRTLTFVESLVVNPRDVDFLFDAQLTGATDASEMFRKVMNLDAAPVNDDTDVAPKPAKKSPNPIRKAAAAKKTASARRTQK